jgi:hypothetical protein
MSSTVRYLDRVDLSTFQNTDTGTTVPVPIYSLWVNHSSETCTDIQCYRHIYKKEYVQNMTRTANVDADLEILMRR